VLRRIENGRVMGRSSADGQGLWAWRPSCAFGLRADAARGRRFDPHPGSPSPRVRHSSFECLRSPDWPGPPPEPTMFAQPPVWNMTPSTEVLRRSISARSAARNRGPVDRIVRNARARRPGSASSIGAGFHSNASATLNQPWRRQRPM
jgi:hypothetical protein